MPIRFLCGRLCVAAGAVDRRRDQIGIEVVGAPFNDFAVTETEEFGDREYDFVVVTCCSNIF